MAPEHVLNSRWLSILFLLSFAQPAGVVDYVSDRVSNLIATAGDNNKVVFHFGNETFRIPKNYFAGGSDIPQPNEPGFFSLIMLLSYLEPRTPDNAAEFNVVGFGRKLNALVLYMRHLADPEGTLALLLSGGGVEKNEYKMMPNNVKYYYLKKEPGFEDLFVKEDEYGMSLLRCEGDNDPPAGPHKYCKSIERISEDFAIDYSFDKTYASEWS